MTQAEKDEQRAKREQTERERAEQEASRAGARRQVARLAAIGALTPHLLNEDEIAGLSKFVLAMMQRAPAEQEQQP